MHTHAPAGTILTEVHRICAMLNAAAARAAAVARAQPTSSTRHSAFVGDPQYHINCMPTLSIVGTQKYCCKCSTLMFHGSRSITCKPLSAGLTPFLVKLLSEDELTTKQALHLIDLQLREQVSFQDVHELYMLDYITSIPSPHLRTCQLLVGLNTAARLVQILKGTAGSGTTIAFAFHVFAFRRCLLPVGLLPSALSLG